MRITKNDETVQYVKVQLDDCQELFERAVLGDEVVERLLYRKEKKVYRHPKEIPFIAKQTRIVLMQNPLTSTWHPAVSLPWKKRCLR